MTAPYDIVEPLRDIADPEREGFYEIRLGLVRSICGDAVTEIKRLRKVEAATGYRPPALVAKVLRIVQRLDRTQLPELFSDEIDALRAATFEVTE